MSGPSRALNPDDDGRDPAPTPPVDRGGSGNGPGLCPKCYRAAHAGPCVRSEVCQACVMTLKKLVPTMEHTCDAGILARSMRRGTR